jgi:hypothetical protein
VTTDGPRLAPLSPEEWPPTMRDAIAALRVANPRHPFPSRDETRPKGLNVLGTFAHHPDLARAYHAFNGHVLFATTLSVRQRGLLVAGLSAEEIDRVAAGADAPGWDPLDRALVTAVDELVRDARIGDDTWAVLAAALDEQQLMDLVFTVGAYDLLAMALRTFEVELDADLERWKRPSL